MAGANTNVQMTNLDFSSIKNSLKTFLQSQNTLKDYNYEGSALSTLLDVLAYNTQYNAYYLNMVANEMFLDSAVQRNSVISHAKLLGYTPKSALAPSAVINLNINQVSDASLTLPKFTNFISEAVNGKNYNFVTMDAHTVNVSGNTASFNNITIKQGIPVTYRYLVDSSTNPNYLFSLSDSNIDTTSITVVIQNSVSDTNSTTFEKYTDITTLNSDSQVFFLQEGFNGTYEIYFGDGVLGKKLTDGNVVIVSYITTQGSSASGANNFVLMDRISGYANNTLYPLQSATQGSDKESINSIKFQAPKVYASQGRAVTKSDYITIIQQNDLGYSFDAVNVWGGEENNPPEYGKIFVAIKPTGSYNLTDTQKQRIINEVILPKSVMTVTPVIVNVDYTYLILDASVIFDSKKTSRTATQISDLVKAGTISYCNQTLNTFNSTLSVSDLMTYVKALDQSIVAIDYDLYLQKRFIPKLNSTQNYTIDFGAEVEQGKGDEALQITPAFAQYDTNGNYYDTVYFEESVDSTTNIDAVAVVSGGNGYTNPVISISGDGSGAIATAVVENGIITAINLTSGGSGYTQAVVTITDPTGTGATATAMLRTNVGELRTYYYKDGVKNILTGAGTAHTSSAGNIDYTTGILTLNNFTPASLNNTDGVMRATGYSKYRIVSSTYDKIITLDPNDSGSVTVSVKAL